MFFVKELLTIIVPVYNAENFIDKCINSILKQTYSNLELILINDGSTDTSKEICEKYELEDARVTLINQENKGVSAARNKGLQNAKGTYIGFVDSDDEIKEEMYRVLINRLLMDRSQIAVLMDYTIKKNENHDLKTTIDQNEAIDMLFKLEFPTSLWAYLYTKESLKGKILNEDIHFLEDFEFNYRILTNGVETVSLINLDLYLYNTNPESLNSQKISEKKLSLLNIIDIVENNLISTNADKKTIDSSIHFKSHFVTSSILSLAKSKDTEKEIYYKKIKKYTEKVLGITYFSSKVSLIEKALLVGFYTQPDLTIKIIRKMKRY